MILHSKDESAWHPPTKSWEDITYAAAFLQHHLTTTATILGKVGLEHDIWAIMV